MELYYVMSIIDKNRAKDMFDIHKELNLSAVFANLGKGTATSEHLLLYDLQESEKVIINAVATGPTMKKLMWNAKRKLYIDIPGNGIMLAVPMKSVSGGRTLTHFTDGQEIGERKPDMNFENELIIVILNEGYADVVMDAARSAGATGGTVLHAKGTAKGRTEKFYGVSLAEEKDMIYIVAPSSNKSNIMKEINRICGVETPSGAVSFSVPVTEVAGIRRFFGKETE